MLGIAHFSLVVSDIEQSIEYYTRWLGFQTGQRSENEKLVLCSLHRDNLTLELLACKIPRETHPPGQFHHLAFSCSDLDSAAATLTAAGFMDSRPEYLCSPDGRRFFFAGGPDGERLEFIDQFPATLHPLERKLAEYLDVFYHSWHQLTEKIDPGRIHELRVASRRLKVVMSFCSKACPPTGLKTAQKRLHTLFSLMGKLRDCHVQLDYIQHSDESILDSHPLVNLLEKEERSLSRKLQRKIDAFDIESFKKQLGKYQRKLHASIYRKQLNKSLAVESQRLLAEYRNNLASTRKRMSASQPDSIHRFRIAAKKLRYSFEALHEYLELNQAFAGILIDLQDRAGHIQDLNVLAEKIESAGSIKAGTRQMMISLLHGQRDELSAQLIESLDHRQYQLLWN